MNIREFVTRLDEEAIQAIVGRNTITILNIIDPNLARLQIIQEVILSIFSLNELLINRNIRDILISVLKPDEAEYLAKKLNLSASGDVYADLLKVNYLTKKNKIALFDFFGVEIQNETTPDDNSYQQSLPCRYALFPHQRRAAREVIAKLYNQNKRVLLHMPTGSGKTRTAMSIICDHLREREATITVWFVNTEELCEQAYEEFSQAWQHLGNREIKILKFWGNFNERIDTLKDGVIIAGLAKMYNLLKDNLDAISKTASRSSLVVFDEAHMAVAPTYKIILQIFTSANASLLGLSATPGRTWNDPTVDQDLANFFNKQKVALKVDGYYSPIEYLISEGYLAKTMNTPLLYKSGLKLTDGDLEYLKDYLQLPDKVLKEISEDNQRNIRIIQEIDKLIRRHSRIIVFAINVTHSNLLATILQARGLNAFSITSNTDSGQRKKLIAYFKSNASEPIVLCNYGILTTGFDAPRTSCAVIARPTDSLVLYSQMVGRAIRGVKAGGNVEAEIVTVVDTSLPGFDKITNAFFNWEDVWE